MSTTRMIVHGAKDVCVIVVGVTAAAFLAAYGAERAAYAVASTVATIF